MDISLADFFPGTDKPRGTKVTRDAWVRFRRMDSLSGGDQELTVRTLSERETSGGAGNDRNDGEMIRPRVSKAPCCRLSISGLLFRDGAVFSSSIGSDESIATGQIF